MDSKRKIDAVETSEKQDVKRVKEDSATKPDEPTAATSKPEEGDTKPDSIKSHTDKGELNYVYPYVCSVNDTGSKTFKHCCYALVGDWRKCNWCCQIKELLEGKKFCKKCSEGGTECAYCHRPMPDRFFTLSKRLCNACFKKHAKSNARKRQQYAERKKTSNIQ